MTRERLRCRWNCARARRSKKTNRKFAQPRATLQARSPIFVRRCTHCRSNITRPSDRIAVHRQEGCGVDIRPCVGHGLVNVIARGPGSKGHSHVALASASGREHRSRIGRDCVRGYCSGGFSAVYALAHAGLRQGGWVRRLVALRGQASASALLIALLLPGCTVGPDYSREPAPVPTTYKELKGWKLANPNDAADRGNWWAPYQRFPARYAAARSRNLQSDGGGGGRGLRAIARHRPRSAIGAVSDRDRLLQRHPHAHRGARRHHRRQLPSGRVAAPATRRSIPRRSTAAGTSTSGARSAAPIEADASVAQASAADLDNAKLPRKPSWPPPISTCSPPIHCAISCTAPRRSSAKPTRSR